MFRLKLMPTPQTITLGIESSTVGISPSLNRAAFQRAARSLLWGHHRRQKKRQCITLPQRVSDPRGSILLTYQAFPPLSVEAFARYHWT